MGMLSEGCPNCGLVNQALAKHCVNCGVTLEAPPAAPASSTAGYTAAMWVFVAAALILLATGFLTSEITAIQQSALFAASAVCGIIARIAQAGGHHVKMMDELRRK